MNQPECWFLASNIKKSFSISIISYKFSISLSIKLYYKSLAASCSTCSLQLWLCQLRKTKSLGIGPWQVQQSPISDFQPMNWSIFNCFPLEALGEPEPSPLFFGAFFGAGFGATYSASNLLAFPQILGGPTKTPGRCGSRAFAERERDRDFFNTSGRSSESLTSQPETAERKRNRLNSLKCFNKKLHCESWVVNKYICCCYGNATLWKFVSL